MLARGHGPFTWGRDGMDSVHTAIVLEEVARMAMWTLSLASGAESDVYKRQSSLWPASNPSIRASNPTPGSLTTTFSTAAVPVFSTR